MFAALLASGPRWSLGIIAWPEDSSGTGSDLCWLGRLCVMKELAAQLAFDYVWRGRGQRPFGQSFPWWDCSMVDLSRSVVGATRPSVLYGNERALSDYGCSKAVWRDASLRHLS